MGFINQLIPGGPHIVCIYIYGYGSKLGTPKLWMVNTKLDIHICGPTSVFHFDPHPYNIPIVFHDFPHVFLRVLPKKAWRHGTGPNGRAGSLPCEIHLDATVDAWKMKKSVVNGV